jgi:hypothetical protein
VRHHPRRVISAHIGNEPESVGEGNERRAAHNLPRRSSANLLVKRLRRVRFGPWEWIGLCASTAACLLLLRGIAGAQSEQHRLRELVTAKQTQLSALNQQKNEEEKKLAYMRSEKGREQVLAERGYLKHGDRILVFPADDKKQQ